MMTLKALIEAFSSPVGLMTILFISGILARIFRPRSQMGNRLVWSGVALYLVFLMTPLAEILFVNLERPFRSMLHRDPSVRNIVVLAAYGEDYSPLLPVTHKLSVETISRMVEGIRLYRDLPGARLIVAGGSLGEEYGPVAILMAEFARVMGVPTRDIVVEELSTTTYENLLGVKNIIGSEPFILVTSSGELQRAVAVARKLGMRPLAAPANFWVVHQYPAGIPWVEWGAMSLRDMSSDRLSYLQRAHHEYLGYLWYWILGRV